MTTLKNRLSLIFGSIKYKKSDNSHSIKLLRKRKNSSAPPNRVIQLYQIDDSDHLVLIKNIEPFIRCIRPTIFSKKQIESRRFCTICFSYIKTNRYSRHYNICLQFKGVPNLVLPNEGKTFKITVLRVREKASIICYYHTEPKLTPKSSIKNVVPKHEIISYNYVVVDKDTQLRIKKFGTGSSNLSQRMIGNINADYKRLYEELKNTWSPLPLLTDLDKKLFIKTKHCMLCEHKFNQHTQQNDIKKVRHPFME